jgi:hypothetical protein
VWRFSKFLGVCPLTTNNPFSFAKNSPHPPLRE